jgi:phenylacetic acid degradation operon negative regulatory protein
MNVRPRSPSERHRSGSIMPNATDQLTTALLRRFHQKRPIRGGSLLVTIFGDSLAPRGGAVTLASRIELARPFGLTERLVRTSIARLAHDGWVVSRRAGRRSEYRLTPNGRRRFAEATRRIYAEVPERWSGRWTLLLPAQGPGSRKQLREELRWLGFGQLAPGLFAHPIRSMSETRELLTELGAAAKQATLMEARSECMESDRRLVSAGWDLAELTQHYRRFVDNFAPLCDALQKHRLDPQAAFVVRTLLIHDYRRIHLRDPLLPASLLPPDWIGNTAYDACRTLYSATFMPAEQFLDVHASTLRGPLPAAAASTFARFGGIAPDSQAP